MTRANLQLTDYDADGRPFIEDLDKVASPLPELLTLELFGAADALGLTSGEILLAALGRTIARVIGSGAVLVDVPGYGASVHPMVLPCTAAQYLDADDMLEGVHHALDSLAVRHVVHGVPNDPRSQSVSEVLFVNADEAVVRPHLGHVLELHAYRNGDTVALDWWYDTRSFEPYTIAEFAEQFPLALIELTSEATPPVHATHELALAH
ncbi:hypothetical protein [Mycolicibacterium sp. 050158]|jgi:hypothetical protein|uniref:hypothetical protein n=1 Tax=Mycolicibacterium sp. 050158 TaxID=3090602 RepID=UPI00299DDF49|nr:hypothetical protein [Mycolicibacterium sp. 050158]MDX1891024.1 hypothetical protein [Mycolicibacterium sp. 050158]